MAKAPKKSANAPKKAAAKRVAAKLAKPRKAATKATNAAKSKQHTIYHKDGSIYGTGQMLGGKMHGYWEFFRKSGKIMRSGSFDREQQVGTWTTYDTSGKPFKVTEMKAGAKAKPAASKVKPIKAVAKPSARTTAKPKLLSGGNPQIAKAYGDVPVKAYIDAMPGWKSAVGRRLDELITAAVPGVRKAVKWNSPMYGAPEADSTYFLGLHVFAKYIKVAFFKGRNLKPLPPDESKQKEVRYLNIYEDAPLDEAQFTKWVKQASELPGEKM